MLVPPDIQATLEQSLARTLNRFRDVTAVAFGKSIPAQYTEEMQKKYEINEMGRIQYQPTKTFFAGPNQVDRTHHYEMPKVDCLSFFEAYAAGKKVEYKMPDFTEPIPIRRAKNGDIHRYESYALFRVAQAFGGVVLLNPSEGALYRCCENRHGSVPFTVMFTGGYDPKRSMEILTQYKMKNQVVKQPMGFPVYVGSNGVDHDGVNYSKYQRWFSLVVSPLKHPFPYDAYSVRRVGQTTRMEYERKGRSVTVLLEDTPMHIVYGPQTVDRWLSHGIVTAAQSFVVETNFLELAAEPESGVPMYVLERFPEVQYPLTEVLEQEGVVYDVPGDGSFLSRRIEVERYVTENFKKIVPLHIIGEIDGTHTVSLYAHSPEASGVHRIKGRNISYIGEVVERERVEKPDGQVVVYGPNIQGEPHEGLPQGGYVWCKSRSIMNTRNDAMSPIFEFLKTTERHFDLARVTVLMRKFRDRVRASRLVFAPGIVDRLEVEVVSFALAEQPRDPTPSLLLLQEIGLMDQGSSLSRTQVEIPFPLDPPYFVCWNRDDLTMKQISILKAIYGVPCLTMRPFGAAVEPTNSRPAVEVMIGRLYAEKEHFVINDEIGSGAGQLAASVGLPVNQLPLIFSGREDIVQWHGGEEVRWVVIDKLRFEYGGGLFRDLWDKWIRSHRVAVVDLTEDEVNFLMGFFFVNNRPVRATLRIERTHWLLRSPDKLIYRDWGKNIQ